MYLVFIQHKDGLYECRWDNKLMLKGDPEWEKTSHLTEGATRIVITDAIRGNIVAVIYKGSPYTHGSP